MTPPTPSATEYPIPVKDFDAAHPSTLIVCEKCGALGEVDPDNLRCEGYYACPRDCGGSATYKYEIAPQCGNCGTLGWFEPHVHGGYCSRVCKLQGEYALELLSQKAAEKAASS